METSTIFISKIPIEIKEKDVLELLTTTPFDAFQIVENYFFRNTKNRSIATGDLYYYAYISYPTKLLAFQAFQMFNRWEVCPGKQISVSISNVPKIRIFVGPIPKELTKDQLWAKFKQLTPKLTKIIMYNNASKPNENRGHCFLEYDSPRLGMIAMESLCEQTLIFDNGMVPIFDWADFSDILTDEEFNQTKALYVRNIMDCIDKHDLNRAFRPIGPIARLKRQKDYVFIHYKWRSDAEKAKQELDGAVFGGVELYISWAKPPPLRNQFPIMTGNVHHPEPERMTLTGLGDSVEQQPPTPPYLLNAHESSEPKESQGPVPVSSPTFKGDWTWEQPPHFFNIPVEKSSEMILHVPLVIAKK